jgi:hypothetical protein
MIKGSSLHPHVTEAERISYKDALFILISVAFGIGYLDVFQSENEVGWYPLAL